MMMMLSSLISFLDETSQNICNLESKDVQVLFDQMVRLIVEEESDEVIEEILKFCSSNVWELTGSLDSWKKLFLNCGKLKHFPNFHVLVSTVTSKIVKDPIEEVESDWIDSLLDALISGLAAIESETISLSGSSLIKLLKWERQNGDGGRLSISKKLAKSSDFVAILSADMCAMFSRIGAEDADADENNQAAPFIRIVRFCELIIDVSDPESGLKERILDTVEKEFINKVYRKTLREMKGNERMAMKWCDGLLKSCHRGNDLVNRLVGEVWSLLMVCDGSNFRVFECDNNFIGIISNEWSRRIKEIVLFLFSSTEETEKIVINNTSDTSSDDDLVYRNALRSQLESFEKFKIPADSPNFRGLTRMGAKMVGENRSVLINWLPYCLKLTEIESCDLEIKIHIDISRKLIEYLDL